MKKAIRKIDLSCAHALLFIRVRFFPQTSVDRMRILAQGAILSAIFWMIALAAAGNAEAAQLYACEKPGWFPEGFGLKDHHLFQHGGYTYLISIYVPSGETSPFLQNQFAYARSIDLCDWEELNTIPLSQLLNADETDNIVAIWAPFVLQDNDQFYLYFTAVTSAGTQSIGLASASDPSDSRNWQPQDMVFQPTHPGTRWKAGDWADARDPMVVKRDGSYHLYYSGSDESGGIIGHATAPSPAGPWADHGAILGPLPDVIPESPSLVHHDGHYYLFYNLSYRGGFYRTGESPEGPWGSPLPFRPGWAHEVWAASEDLWLTSFLTDYSVTISPLVWDATFHPAWPFIGAAVHHLFLPILDRPTNAALLR